MLHAPSLKLWMREGHGGVPQPSSLNPKYQNPCPLKRHPFPATTYVPVFSDRLLLPESTRGLRRKGARTNWGENALGAGSGVQVFKYFIAT